MFVHIKICMQPPISFQTYLRCRCQRRSTFSRRKNITRTIKLHIVVEDFFNSFHHLLWKMFSSHSLLTEKLKATDSWIWKWVFTEMSLQSNFLLTPTPPFVNTEWCIECTAMQIVCSGMKVTKDFHALIFIKNHIHKLHRVMHLHKVHDELI
jgi:hypothetical protein